MNDDDDDDDGLHQYASLLGALKGLHAGGPGHFKDAGGIDADDSDYEQQASEDRSQDEEDEFDFELDYEDGIRKLDFSKVSTSMNDKRKNRKADDLLREELQDLMPLWRSGALGDGDGANRRFKSRAKGYDMYDSDNEFIASSMTGGKKQKKNKKEPHGGSFESLMDINRYTLTPFITYEHHFIPSKVRNHSSSACFMLLVVLGLSRTLSRIAPATICNCLRCPSRCVVRSTCSAIITTSNLKVLVLANDDSPS